MQKYLQDDLENTQSQFINQEIVALSERELESYCIGCRWWSKGNIDGTVPKIQRVEKRKKGQNEY